MANKLKIIMTKGLPASGKSTWAKELLKKEPGKWRRVNKDDLRAMLDGGAWSPEREKNIVATRNLLIGKALDDNMNVVVDDTNFEPIHEKTIRELFGDRAEIEIKFFDTDVHECIERDKLRQNSVGSEVIYKKYRQYILPIKKSQNNRDLGLPGAIIVDLDGTLAINHGRNYYNAETCDQDLVNEPILEIINGLKHYELIFMSGREEKYEEPTRAFLEDKCEILDYQLFMRETGDKRPDEIVKAELFKRIEGLFHIKMVFDDRPKVIKMWRQKGLFVLDVGDGIPF